MKPGADKLIDNDQANTQGKWGVDLGSPQSGVFYAKVRKIPHPAGVCKGDKSPLRSFPDM